MPMVIRSYDQLMQFFNETLMDRETRVYLINHIQMVPDFQNKMYTFQVQQNPYKGKLTIFGKEKEVDVNYVIKQ